MGKKQQRTFFNNGYSRPTASPLPLFQIPLRIGRVMILKGPTCRWFSRRDLFLRTFQQTPVSHTPNPQQPTVYVSEFLQHLGVISGIDVWGMLHRYVGVPLDFYFIPQTVGGWSPFQPTFELEVTKKGRLRWAELPGEFFFNAENWSTWIHELTYNYFAKAGNDGPC